MEIRRIVSIVEDVKVEGGRAAETPVFPGNNGHNGWAGGVFRPWRHCPRGTARSRIFGLFSKIAFRYDSAASNPLR